ncbi:hypothetical protein HAX54_027373, partial [Datura stramonium]|nr:hypothetical protein [Datura stramonium]
MGLQHEQSLFQTGVNGGNGDERERQDLSSVGEGGAVGVQGEAATFSGRTRGEGDGEGKREMRLPDLGDAAAGNGGCCLVEETAAMPFPGDGRSSGGGGRLGGKIEREMQLWCDGYLVTAGEEDEREREKRKGKGAAAGSFPAMVWPAGEEKRWRGSRAAE